MSPFLRMLRDEWLYLRYSRAPWVLMAVLLVMAATVGWNASTYARGAYRNYTRAFQEMRDSGENPEAMLTQPANIKMERSGDSEIAVTDNPIRSGFDEVTRTLQSVQPRVLVPNMLGAIALLIGPLAFSAWGVAFATYDYSNRTVKTRAINGSWPRAVLAKIIANAVTVGGVIVAVIAVVSVGARGLTYYATSYMVPNSQVFLAQARVSGEGGGNLLLQAAVTAFVAVVFSTLAFSGGIIFRRMWVPLGIVAAYNLVIPSLGRYDLKNATAVVVRSVFSIGSDLQIIQPVALDVWMAYAILAATFGIAVTVSLFAAKSQSKFVS